MTKAFLYNFIKQNKFAVLSTISRDNKPQSACVGIAVTLDLKLVFDTTNDSRKFKNLDNNSNVSFVIGWENGQTIQYEGTAINFDKNEYPELLKTYLDTFPDGLDRIQHWNNITYFVVEPTWIRFSDFNEKVPQIEELNFY
jgi:uncharacterized pyridoxamine 5'-phosphate oxidase family protein